MPSPPGTVTVNFDVLVRGSLATVDPELYKSRLASMIVRVPRTRRLQATTTIADASGIALTMTPTLCMTCPDPAMVEVYARIACRSEADASRLVDFLGSLTVMLLRSPSNLGVMVARVLALVAPSIRLSPPPSLPPPPLDPILTAVEAQTAASAPAAAPLNVGLTAGQIAIIIISVCLLVVCMCLCILYANRRAPTLEKYSSSAEQEKDTTQGIEERVCVDMEQVSSASASTSTVPTVLETSAIQPVDGASDMGMAILDVDVEVVQQPSMMAQTTKDWLAQREAAAATPPRSAEGGVAQYGGDWHMEM